MWHGLYLNAGDHKRLCVNTPQFPNLRLHINPKITNKHMIYIYICTLGKQYSIFTLSVEYDDSLFLCDSASVIFCMSVGVSRESKRYSSTQFLDLGIRRG
jgi:hypothetical protein